MSYENGKTIYANPGKGMLNVVIAEDNLLRSLATLRERTVNCRRSIGIKRQGGGMANSMNKSAVITGAGAYSIIRAAKTLLPSHYSPQALPCEDLCTDRGSITHNLFRESGL